MSALGKIAYKNIDVLELIKEEAGLGAEWRIETIGRTGKIEIVAKRLF